MTIRLRKLILSGACGGLIATGTFGLPAQAGSVRSSAAAVAGQVVFIGDSITFGLGSDNPTENSRPALLRRTVGRGVEVINLGVNGTTLDAIARGNPQLPRIRRNARNVVVILAGSNDLQAGAGSMTIYTALRDFAFQLHRQGWSVAVGTVLARSFPKGKEKERITLNTAIRSGELVRNGIAVLDYAASQQVGHIPLADGIHPNDAGYRKMASMERPFVLMSLHRH